jgi:hypothetical protein
MTIMKLEQDVGSIYVILCDSLKMRDVNAKFLLRQLTTDQMECRMMVARDVFDKSTQDRTFHKRFATDDESLVFACDPEMKMQSSEWHMASPKENTPHQIQGKSVAHCFLSCQ